MKEYSVTINDSGRIVIPAIFRKELDIKSGDELILSLSPDNDIVLHSPKQSLHKLQKLFKSSKKSFVDELIKMRRKEEI